MSDIDPHLSFKDEVDTLGNLDTKVIKIDPAMVDAEESKFEFAKELIQRGEVVAFPTETVYGLGANALDANAVGKVCVFSAKFLTRKIFKTKKRPSDNPLIVHISDEKMLHELTAQIPEDVVLRETNSPLGSETDGQVLAWSTYNFVSSFKQSTKRVCPNNQSFLTPRVTCGLPTVGVRMPSHPIALKLIALSGVPIAAPSANLSGRPSPTQAEHVYVDLKGRCECIIDGGSTEVGLESTVVNLETKYFSF